jgi:hypothetical protein
MAIFGFVVGFLILLYLLFAVNAVAFVSAAFGDKKEGGWLFLIGNAVVVALFWLLFTNAPFTITVAG